MVDEIRVVEQRGVHGQPICTFLDSTQRSELLGLQERLRPRQLVIRDEVAADPLELLLERLLHAFEGDARPNGRPAGHDRRPSNEAEREQGDVLGDALVADEPVVQAAALAVGEDLGTDLQRVETLVAIDRRPKAEVQSRQGNLVRDHLSPLLAQHRRNTEVPQAGDGWICSETPEITLDPRPCLRAFEVADEHEHGVVRGVVRPEERADVLERGGIEIRHRADRRVVVGMILGEHMRLELLVPGSVRPVVVRPAFLVLHDLALVVEVLLRQCIEQRAHPVGFQPQRELELVRGHRLVVVRPIEPGRAVHRAARRLDQGDMLGLADVRRAFEHHVLEEVRETGLARHLVLRSDVVPDVHRDDGDEVVLGQDQAQAIRQALVGETDLGYGHVRPPVCWASRSSADCRGARAA